MKKQGVALLLAVLVSGSAWAHRMDIGCVGEGESLLIQAWTGGNDPVRDGEVTISNEDGTILETGRTDAEGNFRWKPDVIQGIKIKVYGGEGHQKTLTITKQELASLLPGVSGTGAPNPVEPSKHPSVPRISTQHSFGTPERIIIGFTFLAALSAAWFAYRSLVLIKQLAKKP